MNPLRHWKIIVGLLLVFCAGAVTGGLVTHQLIKTAIEKSLKFENWSAGALDVLQKKLSLTPDQHQKMESVFEQTGREFKAVFGRTMDDSGKIIVSTQRQIDQILTPEQRAIHSEMKREFREGLKKRFDYDLPKE